MRLDYGPAKWRPKVEHIDSQRMLIKIVNGKGAKTAIHALHSAVGATARLLQKIPAQDVSIPSSFKTRTEHPLSYESLRCIYDKARKKAGSQPAQAFTPYAIALPPICWKPDSISAKSRSSWATAEFQPPSFICMSVAKRSPRSQSAGSDSMPSHQEDRPMSLLPTVKKPPVEIAHILPKTS